MWPKQRTNSSFLGMYLVKEIFGPTVQGEGAHAGMACVFLRFARCNLNCSWCDTDFSTEGAKRMDAQEVVEQLLHLDQSNSRRVVVTGGEPSLQWKGELPSLVQAAGFSVHMETNGTQPLQAAVDWLTISPKEQFHEGSTQLFSLEPSECKVVVDDTTTTDGIASYKKLYPKCEHWYLQPCDDKQYDSNLEKALQLIELNPTWRLSLQLHKIIGVQ